MIAVTYQCGVVWLSCGVNVVRTEMKAGGVQGKQESFTYDVGNNVYMVGVHHGVHCHDVHQNK